jgi:hypothetical protein
MKTVNSSELSFKGCRQQPPRKSKALRRSKINKFTEIEQGCEIYVIRGKYLRRFSRRPLVLITFILPLLSAVAPPVALKGRESGNLTKNTARTKISSKFTSDKPHVHDGKIIRENSFRNNPKVNRKNFLYASQFGFRARYSATLQCVRLMGYVTFD